MILERELMTRKTSEVKETFRAKTRKSKIFSLRRIRQIDFTANTFMNASIQHGSCQICLSLNENKLSKPVSRDTDKTNHSCNAIHESK